MKWSAPAISQSVMVLWSPWGVHTCKGRNWAELFNPEVPSGSVCLTCLWPQPRQQLIRLSDRALIADHQAQWTINLNKGGGDITKRCYMYFGTSCTEILINVFHEQACTKNRVERFHCLLCLSPLPQALGKRDRREADRASFNTLSERNWESCPSEKCEVNEKRHANSPPHPHPSIYYVKIFDWGGLKAHYLQTT